MKYIYCYKTKLGEIGIIEEKHAITEIKFNDSEVIGEIVISETPLIHQTYLELEEYLEGKRENFTIPLNLKGTSFQKKVWKQILTIPYGKTTSYKHIAVKIGNPKSFGAIGIATKNNPIPILIPCHRVIGVNENITESNLERNIKKELLWLEKDKS